MISHKRINVRVFIVLSGHSRKLWSQVSSGMALSFAKEDQQFKPIWESNRVLYDSNLDFEDPSSEDCLLHGAVGHVDVLEEDDGASIQIMARGVVIGKYSLNQPLKEIEGPRFKVQTSIQVEEVRTFIFMQGTQILVKIVPNSASKSSVSEQLLKFVETSYSVSAGWSQLSQLCEITMAIAMDSSFVRIEQSFRKKIPNFSEAKYSLVPKWLQNIKGLLFSRWQYFMMKVGGYQSIRTQEPNYLKYLNAQCQILETKELHMVAAFLECYILPFLDANFYENYKGLLDSMLFRIEKEDAALFIDLNVDEKHLNQVEDQLELQKRGKSKAKDPYGLPELDQRTVRMIYSQIKQDLQLKKKVSEDLGEPGFHRQISNDSRGYEGALGNYSDNDSDDDNMDYYHSQQYGRHGSRGIMGRQSGRGQSKGNRSSNFFYNDFAKALEVVYETYSQLIEDQFQYSFSYSTQETVVATRRIKNKVWRQFMNNIKADLYSCFDYKTKIKIESLTFLTKIEDEIIIEVFQTPDLMYLIMKNYRPKHISDIIEKKYSSEAEKMLKKKQEIDQRSQANFHLASHNLYNIRPDDFRKMTYQMQGGPFGGGLMRRGRGFMGMRDYGMMDEKDNQIPDWKIEILQKMKKSSPAYKKKYEKIAEIKPEIKILMTIPCIGREINSIITTFFKRLQNASQIYDWEGVWIWASIIRSCLLVGISSLARNNLVDYFDHNSYLSDLESSNPFELSNRTLEIYLEFTHKLMPEEVIEDSKEQEFYQRVARGFKIDIQIVFMDLLMREKFIRESNLPKFMHILLKAYQLQYKGQGIARSSMIYILLQACRKDKQHILNEIFEFFRFEKQSDLRIKWRDVVKLYDEEYPCPDFTKLFIKNQDKKVSMGGQVQKERGATLRQRAIELPMPVIKMLEIICTVFKQNKNTRVIQYLKGKRNGYVKFLSDCNEYIDFLEKRTIPVTGIYRLEAFYSNFDASEGPFPNELCFIFDLAELNSNRHAKIQENIQYFLSKYKEVETKVSNCLSRIDLLDFIEERLRRQIKERVAPLVDLSSKFICFKDLLESPEYSITLLFDDETFDSYSSLQGYPKFIELLAEEIGKNSQMDIAGYLNIYQCTYSYFKNLFETANSQLKLDTFIQYFQDHLIDQEAFNKICRGLKLESSPTEQLWHFVSGFIKVINFIDLYPALESYCSTFKLQKCELVKIMKPLFKKVVKTPNFDTAFVSEFYNKVINICKDYDTIIARKEIVIKMDKYSELIAYVREKGVTFFESIRTEIDEADVDDFMKVTNINRFLYTAYTSKMEADFIGHIAKLSEQVVLKIDECLLMVGPRIDHIKELSQRANQTNTNDFENIQVILQGCTVVIKWYSDADSFKSNIEYKKGKVVSRYNYKKFEELFKKEQILRDSEIHDTTDEEGDAKLNASIHSKFVEFGELVLDTLAILNRLKNLGLIDNTFEVLDHTYSRQYKKLTTFSVDRLYMKLHLKGALAPLQELREVLALDFENAKEYLYNKFQDSDYINLTYFFGKRLYDLSDYIQNPGKPLPQTRELFKEIGPDFDPLKVKTPSQKDKEQLLDLKTRVQTISQFLRIEKKKRITYEIDDPISIEKKVSYFVNHSSDSQKAILPTMPLVHYILESHNIQSVKGTSFLQCSTHTTDEEIVSFCYRSVYSKTTKASFILNPENLTKSSFNKLRVCYEEIIASIKKTRSLNVVIIFGDSNKDYIDSLKNSLFFVRYVRKLDPSINNGSSRAQMKLTTVFYSEYAGMGKTTTIKREANHNILTLFLTGELSKEVLSRRLANFERALDKVQVKCDLHIKLDTLEELVHSNGVVDFLVYQVCFLRRVQTDSGCLSLEKLDRVFIEIGNTIGLSLLTEKFTSVGLFEAVKISAFQAEMLIYDADYQSPEQRVAYYLRLLETGDIATKDFTYFEEALPELEYKKVMRNTFMIGEQAKNRAAITYAQFNSWVRVCHRLFTEFDAVEELKPAVVIRNRNEKVRVEFGRLIRDFATRLIQFSVEQARTSQKEMYSIKKNFEQEKDRLKETWDKFEKMQKWDAANHIVPLIMNGRFMVYCGDERLFRKYPNLKLLVEHKKKQILGGAATAALKTSQKAEDFLKVYDYLFKYEPGTLSKRARRFPNLPENCDNESGVEEGYVITEENNIKSALMLVKAMVGDPIVIMGESGCGKTFFSKFTASCLQQEEIRVLTLHAGVKEGHLLFFLKECIKRALELKSEGKKLWILFDEFNTSSQQAIVAEIMQDRACSIDDSILEIPDNFVFVACCNPFQLRVTKSELGLIPDTAENRLSHKVYLVLESLMNYVWDFGQLTELDEKNHIYSIIDSENIFKGRLAKESNSFVKSVVYQAHRFLRRNSPESGVSLRDIKRVIAIIKWAHGYLTLMQQELGLGRKERIIMATLITVNLCYVLRLNGMPGMGRSGTQESLIEELYSQIYKKSIPLYVKMNQRAWTARKMLARLQKVELSFAKELQRENCIPDDIALNKPLRENLFTLFACYSTLTPLMICGKPGTSKTLCAQIFAIAMKSEVSPKIKSLRGLPNSTEIYYGGSQTSTDVGIKRVFDRADRIIAEDVVKGGDDDDVNNIDMLRPLILIDEIGLAELSPYNPLKILHPKLEKKDKKYAFLGVSNWTLDLSKMNRVIYLARPDMDYQDLEDTFVSITGLQANRCQGLMSSFVESYLDFRAWQVKYAPHKNFHGSRDVYSVFKNMKVHLKRQDVSEGDLVALLRDSIERNFSGALYPLRGDTRFNAQNSSMIAAIPQSLAVSNGKVEFGGVENYNREKEFIRLSMMNDLYQFLKVQAKSSGDLVFEESSQTIKRILINKNSLLRESVLSVKDFYKNKKPLDNIVSNLEDPNARFLLLSSENSVIDSMLIELIRNKFPGREVIDWRSSRLTKSENDHETTEMLSMMKTYIQNGYIVVMKNIDELFGSLYDLFNQKYIEREGKKYCYLYYGDEKPRAQVHPDFKCIIIMEEDENVTGSKAEVQQPAPFLNRFEKYKLKIVDLLNEGQIAKLKTVVQEGIQVSGGIESRLVSLNIEMFASMVINRDGLSGFAGKQGRLPVGSLEQARDKILRLTTSNYLLSSETQLTKKTVVKFQEQHPYDSLLDLLEEFKDPSKIHKSTVFTYSSTFGLQKVMAQFNAALGQQTGPEGRWTFFSSDQLESVGTARRKVLIEMVTDCNIMIQFTKQSHLSMLPSLKYIIDKKTGRTEQEFRSKRAKSKINRVPGCLIVVHMSDESDREHSRNSSLNFWDCWDNVVIENLSKSDYSQIHQLFSFEEDKSSSSIYNLLSQNSDLRSAVIEKYCTKVLRKVSDKCSRLGLEREMNEVSMLFSNWEMFTSEFSSKLIEVPILKKCLQSVDNSSLFALCRDETSYFKYEDKLIEVLPKAFEDYVTRLLTEYQAGVKFSAINKMLHITDYANYEGKKEMVRATMLQVEEYIKKIEPDAEKPISMSYWMKWRMTIQGDLSKNPVVSFPYLVGDFCGIMNVITDPNAYPDITSIERELKDKIEGLMTVEELAVDQSQHNKYKKLWSLLSTRIAAPIASHLDGLATALKGLANSEEERCALLFEITKNLLEEYFRFEGKPLEGGASKLLVTFVMKMIGSLDWKESILEVLMVLKAFDSKLYTVNSLIKRIRLSIDLEEMVNFEKVDTTTTKNGNGGMEIEQSQVQDEQQEEQPKTKYQYIKEFENSALIRLVFDSDEKSKNRINKISENIENVEFLNFNRLENTINITEVTTKENVRILRIILSLLRLILKSDPETSEDPDKLSVQDSVRLQEIFEKSKVAFKPNLYRYECFLEFFVELIKVHGRLLRSHEQQEELVNIFIALQLVNCDIFRRDYDKYMQGIKRDNSFAKRILENTLRIYIDPEVRGLFQEVDFQLLYKIANQTSHFLGKLFRWRTSIDDAVKNFPNLIKPTRNKKTQEFVALLDQKLVNPALTQSRIDHSDPDDLKIVLCKALSDVFTEQFEEMLKMGSKNEQFMEQATHQILDTMEFLNGLEDSLQMDTTMLKRLAFVRAFFNYDMCASYNRFPHRKLLDDKFMEVIIGDPETGAASSFSSPAYVVLLNLMCNFNTIFQEGIVVASVNRKIDLLYKFIDIVNPKKALDPIMMDKPSLMSMQQVFTEEYEKKKLIGQNKDLINVLWRKCKNEAVSKEMFNYLFGVVIINLLMKQETDADLDGPEEEQEAPDNNGGPVEGKVEKFTAGKETDRAYLRSLYENDPGLKQMGSSFYTFIGILINGEFQEINKFARLPNFLYILKTVLHYSLIVVCYQDTGKIGQKIDSGSWKRGTIQPCLLAPMPREERYHGLLDKLQFVQETRFQEGGLNIYRDIGVYECDCGFSYHVMNCGMTMVKTKCPKCKKEIGGISHKMVDRQGHVHYSKMEQLVTRIKELRNLSSRDYAIHNLLPYNDDEYKSYDILEGEQPRTVRIMKHMFDHCFLLTMPYLVKPKEKKKLKDKMADYFDQNTEFRETYKKMNNIKLEDQIDYFMAHVMFDAEMMGKFSNIGYKDSITLANFMMTKCVESMDGSGINLEGALLHNYDMVYQHPKSTLLNIQKKVDDYSKDVVSVEKKVFDFTQKKIGCDDLKAFFGDYYYYALMLRNLPQRNLYDEFRENLREPRIKQGYPFLCEVYNYGTLLEKYKDLVFSHVDFVNELNRSLNGLYTKEQARVTSLSQIMEEHKDTPLKAKYSTFKTVWETIVPAVKDDNGELFNIAFMCQRNLDPEAYFSKLVSPNELMLMDVALVESDTNEGIFMLGIIQTLVKWQQKLLIKARKLINRPECLKKRAQEASPEDFLSPIDVDSTIRENTFYNYQFNQENIANFDYQKIETDIAYQISEDRFILQFDPAIPNSIEYYRFNGEFKENQQIMDKVIKRIIVRPLSEEMLELVDGLSLKMARKMKRFIISLCEELFNQVIYDSDFYIEEVASRAKTTLRSFDTNLFGKGQLGHLAGFLNHIKIKEVNKMLEQKGMEMGQALSETQRKLIAEFFEVNRNAEGELPVAQRVKAVSNDIKSKIYEILKDDSKYAQFKEYDFLLFISLEDEPFNLYMAEGQGSEEPISGKQFNDLFQLFNTIVEKSQ